MKTRKDKQFKIRVNSFHRTKMDSSLYDPWNSIDYFVILLITRSSLLAQLVYHLSLPLQLVLQLVQFRVQPRVLLNESLISSCVGFVISSWILFSFGVFVFLLVVKFVIHVAFLNLCTTLHKSLDFLVHFLVFPHGVYFLLTAFKTRKVSEKIVSIVLN